jgi:hypothetical protein
MDEGVLGASNITLNSRYGGWRRHRRFAGVVALGRRTRYAAIKDTPQDMSRQSLWLINA